MSEETKLPKLAVGYMDQGMGHGHYAVVVAETNELLDVKGPHKGRIELIVRACNSHEDLRKACEKVINILRGKDGGHSHSDKIGLRCTVCQCMATGTLEAAIAKAKEN